MINNHKDLPKFTSDHGETVTEFFGASTPGAGHSMAFIEIAPESSCLKHFHPKCDESYYILSGRAQMRIGDKVQTIGAGDSVFIAPNQEHQITNLSADETLKFIAVCTPPWNPECSVFI